MINSELGARECVWNLELCTIFGHSREIPLHAFPHLHAPGFRSRRESSDF